MHFDDETIYDLVGVGVGPFNLGLACLTQPLTELKAVFFEQKDGFDWHSGIMPEWSTLQIPFIADLVSFADPVSRFSFLNYLKQKGNLYQFYIRENFYILRSEYNQYCKWAADQLDNLRFGSRIDSITVDDYSGCYRVSGINRNNNRFAVLARNLVLGTGTTPVVPDFCLDFVGKVKLGANYIHHKEECQKSRSITVVGSGQSGAEIYYDLLMDADKYGYQLNWITQSDRFFSMDLGKLTLEFTSPDYTDHFFSLSPEKRDQIIESQGVLYKGINLSLVNNIYDLLYIRSQKDNFKTRLLPSTRLESLHRAGDGLELQLRQVNSQKAFSLNTDTMILALGYRYQLPDFVNGILPLLNRDPKGQLQLHRNYSVNNKQNVFVQNVGLHSHGISVNDLGMGCYRNSIIINKIIGRDVYGVESRIAFQEFAVA